VAEGNAFGEVHAERVPSVVAQAPDAYRLGIRRSRPSVFRASFHATDGTGDLAVGWPSVKASAAAT
jgi:hypothetical protein